MIYARPSRWQDLLALLLPSFCRICKARGEFYCAACRAEIVPVPPGIGCPPGLQEVVSTGLHEGSLRRAVHRLKYDRWMELVPVLSFLLAETFRNGLGDRLAEACLVPVPLHWTGHLRRGFNQSEQLARGVAREIGLPVVPILRRIRPTPSQVSLPGRIRRLNLENAFATVPGAPRLDRPVVLVDDVWTTGATLTECARTLRALGAPEVFGLTLSCAGGNVP